MPSADLTVHVYEGARHEVLNETNRDEVIGHLADWMERVSRQPDHPEAPVPGGVPGCPPGGNC